MLRTAPVSEGGDKQRQVRHFAIGWRHGLLAPAQRVEGGLVPGVRPSPEPLQGLSCFQLQAGRAACKLAACSAAQRTSLHRISRCGAGRCGAPCGTKCRASRPAQAACAAHAHTLRARVHCRSQSSRQSTADIRCVHKSVSEPWPSQSAPGVAHGVADGVAQAHLHQQRAGHVGAGRHARFRREALPRPQQRGPVDRAPARRGGR